MLEIQQIRCWHNIVTIDESWFHLLMGDEMIWLQSDEKVAEKERHTLQSTKIDAHDRLDSQRLSLNQSSSQWAQVQRDPLRNQYSWSTGRLAHSSGAGVESETDHPCR
jgi:hypothetical protein